MANVTDAVVKEYFEVLGYLVSQPHKHAIVSRSKSGEEDIDLVVLNPAVAEHRLPSNFVWDTADLHGVRAAVVGVRGWHTERIYAADVENSPELLRFLRPAAMKFAAGMLGSQSFAKILCLPALPASGELKDKTIKFLKSGGVDGVIPFRTMLLELVRRVETNRNYDKSDLLQLIRLMKNYDLVSIGQMELFLKRQVPSVRKPRKPRQRAGEEPTPESVPVDAPEGTSKQE